MSGTVGIERIFPINLPTIKKIEVNKKGKVKKGKVNESVYQYFDSPNIKKISE